MKEQWDKKKCWRLGGVLLVCILVTGGLLAYSASPGKQGSRQAVAEKVTTKSAEPSSAAMAKRATGDEKQQPDGILSSVKNAGNHTAETTEEETLSLMMVGDDLLHKPVSDSGRKKNGKYNYDLLFEHVRQDAKAADIAMINQEVVLGGAKLGISGYPSFNGRYEVGNAIAGAGFNVVLHATNHSLDKGAAGVKNCLRFWRTKHPDIKVTGMNASAKAQNKITYIKKKGICVAILNYTYGTNGIAMPESMPYAVNLLTEKRVSRDVRKAKKKADFIVVCPHWGTEYKTGIDACQKKWAGYFLKLGVDLVIGTHPHVIEPVKWMQDNKGHRMLVYYSLGNFINSTSRSGKGIARQFYGGMAKVNLKRNVAGRVVISEAKFVPLITHKKADGKVTTYKVADYSPEMASKNRIIHCDSGFSYQGMKQFFRKKIAGQFLEMD